MNDRWEEEYDMFAPNVQGDIKVTGERTFDSGAQRDPNVDKGRYDLLSPLFLRRLAVHTQKGGKVRGDRNWETGMPMDAVLDSAIRHLYNYLEGDRSEDHLAAAAWNVMNLIHTEEQIERGNLPKSLADGLPDYTEKPKVEIKVKRITHEDVYLPPEEVNQMPYITDLPYEHYDFIPTTAVAEFKELERCCENCIHGSPVGGPVPLSLKCDMCQRLSKWSSTTEEPLGPEDLIGSPWVGC